MRKRRDLGQPSDIAFLLIIFFLLLAGINTTQGIALHTSVTTATQTDNVVLQALLTQQGAVVLENETHTPLSFAQKLTSGTTLHLSVEAETSWQQVVDLLSLTDQRQIAGLSLTLADGATTGMFSKSEGELVRETQSATQQDNRKQAGVQEENLQELDAGNTKVMAP